MWANGSTPNRTMPVGNAGKVEKSLASSKNHESISTEQKVKAGKSKEVAKEKTKRQSGHYLKTEAT